MADKRMFSKKITDSDAFLDMPLSTQALYFHLSMHGDDDGFVNSPKRIARTIGATDDELMLLVAKGFLIPFESGVVVIKHWKIHNYIQSDRYKPTTYTDERALLDVKPNKAYTFADGMAKEQNLLTTCVDTECIQDVSSLDSQIRLDKNRLDKNRLEERGKRKRFQPPSLEEVESYISEKGYDVDAEAFIAFYESNGWKVGKNPMKSWKGAVTTWARRDAGKQPKAKEVTIDAEAQRLIDHFSTSAAN